MDITILYMLLFLKKHRFKIFFLNYIVFFIVEPLDTPVIDKILGYGLIMAFAISPYLLNPGKSTMFISILFALLTFYIVLLPWSTTPSAIKYAIAILVLCVYCIIISYIFWYTLSREVISTDLIYLSLLGYFLIGFGFFLVYGTLQDIGLVVFEPKAKLPKDELIYYSYTALTTLGFGDIVPVTDIGRRLTNIESCTGVLYVAVFIGRLIGLHAILRKKPPE